MKVRIGTRKSKLALAQTEMFANALKKRFDDIDTFQQKEIKFLISRLQ